MLRITAEQQPAGGQLLHIEGRLAGPWVGTLESECRRLLGAGYRLTLDLAGVWFADVRGVQLLRELEERRVTLRGRTPFVAAQLREQHP
jgi:hypothetical protein